MSKSLYLNLSSENKSKNLNNLNHLETKDHCNQIQALEIIYIT